MKRKTYALIVFAVMLSFLSGCGEKEDAKNDTREESADESEDEAETERPDPVTDPLRDEKPDSGSAANEQDSEAKEDLIAAKLLYEDENDEDYMTPDTDDYRIIVYDVPQISVVYNYGIYTDPMGYPEAYVLFPNGNERIAGCKYVELTSYDPESGVNIIRSKLVYETEEDAMHPYVANDPAFWYYFADYSGEYGVIPEDFDEEEAVRMICDEFIPDRNRSGEDADTVREGNIWYKVYYDDNRRLPLDRFAGLLLYPVGSDYSARSTDDDGVSRFTGTYEYQVDGQVSGEKNLQVTVYYSRPENHGKSDGSVLTLEDVEAMLDELDDAVCFAPASPDYVYIVEYANETGSRIVLASFDGSGKLMQVVTREARTDDFGFGNYMLSEYEALSDDKMVLYRDDYAFFEAEGELSFTDRSRDGYIGEWEMEYEYDIESGIQIVEGK